MGRGERVGVRVDVYDAESGRFPDVCVRTGGPAGGHSTHWLIEPAWATMFSLMLAAFVYGWWWAPGPALPGSITVVRLPLCHLEAARLSARRRRHRWSRLVIVLAGAGVGVAIGSSLVLTDLRVPLGAAAVVSAVVLVGAVVAAACTRDPMHCRLRGRAVQFDAHPGFATAMERRIPGSAPVPGSAGRPRVVPRPRRLPTWDESRASDGGRASD